MLVKLGLLRIALEEHFSSACRGVVMAPGTQGVTT